MRDKKTLKEVFPHALEGNGLFTEIAKIEWFEDLSPADFDTYFFMQVGDRIAANKMQFFVNDAGVCEGENLTKIAKVIFNINAISWRNIYRDLTAEYNPIENTDYVETLKEKAVSNGEASTESTGSGGGLSTTTSSKYGFNSTNAVPDTVTESADQNSTTANTATQTDNTNTVERELRKHGNIGTVSNSAIIEADLNLWRHKIADKFIQDICDIIALSIY